MKLRIITLLCCLSFTFVASAQASGGQIARKGNGNVVHAKSTTPVLKLIDWNSVKQTDIELIEGDLSKSLTFLNSLSETTSYIEERPMVQNLLRQNLYNITPNDLIQYKKVRSIQVEPYGIFLYDFFNCKFSMRNGTIFFQKTTGSQRKSGYIYRKDDKSAIFLGGWSVNDEPLTKYGSDNSVIGSLYKISSQKLIMLFYYGNSFELYEFSR